MLCTEKELQLSDFHETIMELGPDAPVGKSLADLFGDLIFEISLTPNLGHCMSIVGIARDLAALLDEKAIRPQVKVEETGEKIGLKIEIKDPENCYRYSARRIRNVQVGPSPDWLKLRLEHAGVRSINNVVDVTNFVMLELGQPLHAFDGKKVHDQKIIVDSLKAPTEFAPPMTPATAMGHFPS